MKKLKRKKANMGVRRRYVTQIMPMVYFFTDCKVADCEDCGKVKEYLADHYKAFSQINIPHQELKTKEEIQADVLGGFNRILELGRHLGNE